MRVNFERLVGRDAGDERGWGRRLLKKRPIRNKPLCRKFVTVDEKVILDAISGYLLLGPAAATLVMRTPAP